jgi:hypothetical protein
MIIRHDGEIAASALLDPRVMRTANDLVARIGLAAR